MCVTWRLLKFVRQRSASVGESEKGALPKTDMKCTSVAQARKKIKARITCYVIWKETTKKEAKTSSLAESSTTKQHSLLDHQNMRSESSFNKPALNLRQFITLHLSCSTRCTAKRAYLFQNREEQVPVNTSCQDKRSLPVSTQATPRRETMKGNNNLESWKFTACWMEIRDFAVFAEIKTLFFHIGFAGITDGQL